MKIVTLDRRHKAYKKGYTCGIKFPEWGHIARDCEAQVSKQFEYGSDWYWEFGAKNKSTKLKPYWIYFRSESSITFLQLIKI